MKTIYRKVKKNYLKVKTFYQKIIKHFLVNHPFLWAGRTPQVLVCAVVLLVFNLGLSTVLPVSFTEIPNSNLMLIFLVSESLLGLGVWVYSQKLLAISVCHGPKSRFYDVRCVMLFFAVFVLASMVVVLPYLNLNRRIKEACTDSQLPIGSVDLSYCNRFYPLPGQPDSINSMVDCPDAGTADSRILPSDFRPDPVTLGNIERICTELPPEKQLNIKLVMGLPPYPRIPGLMFGKDLSGKWLRFIIPSRREAALDTLLVYYNAEIKTETLYSKKFDQKFYARQFRAKLTSSETGRSIDTVIGRFFFHSNIYQDFVVSDSATLQLRILTEKLEVKYVENAVLLAKVDMNAWLLRRENRYFAARNEIWYGWQTLYTGGFVAYCLATLVLIGFTSIRLFGLRNFLLGLAVACIAGSLLYYLVAYGYFVAPAYQMILWIMFPLLALLTVIGRRRPWDLVIFQIGCYAVGYIVVLFPFKMRTFFAIKQMGFPAPQMAFGTLPLLAIPMIFLFVFSTVFTKKAYQLYTRPND